MCVCLLACFNILWIGVWACFLKRIFLFVFDMVVISMEKVGDALEEVLSKALSQRSITIGVYEAAKLLNV